MVRVLTNDGLQAASIEALRALGVEVVNEHIGQDVLGEKLKDFDAVVIRSATKLTEDVLFDVEVLFSVTVNVNL